MAATDTPDATSATSGKRHLEEATQAAKDSAGELWGDARDSARATLNDRKDTAAQGLDEVAGALRNASRQHKNDSHSELVSGLTGSAAEGLERLSSTLRDKDAGSMLRDMERFAHRQPMAFFGLALAAGFATVRFLRASDDDEPAARKHDQAPDTMRTRDQSSPATSPN